MKFEYTGNNKIRKTFNEYAKAALVLYATLGSAYNLAFKTGHQSVDLATGRSQPTAIEQMILDKFEGDKK